MPTTRCARRASFRGFGEPLLDLVRNVIAPGCLGLALILIARRLEKTFPIEPNQPRREVWLDWLLVISGYVVSYIVLSLITITSGDIVAAFGGALFHLPGDTWWTYLSSLVIYVLCGDLYRYWWHRMYHIVPALWAVHSFHHSAEAVTFVTGARFHWLNRIIDAFFPLFAIIVQVPHSVVLAGIFIYFLPDGGAHLNVRFSLGRFVMWINSPQYHRIHHSTRPEHFDKNFASLLPLWDTVFDTAWRPGKDEYPPTGLPDGTKPQSIWEGIIWPVRTLIPKMSFTKSQ
jgi:sterol desaturase/sphingolipid hydroxylase (fatty acid hydroxylase superfamily)